MYEDDKASKSEVKVIAVLLIVVLLAMVGIGSAIYIGVDDQPIEEISESIIEEHTGLDVDLTPKSKENK